MIPKVKLISQWKLIIGKAWSMRLMLIAAVMSGIEIALPLFDMWHPFPPLMFAILSMLFTAGAFIARICAQKDIT